MKTEIELSYETFKEQNKQYKKTNRKLLKSILKISPRDEVIEILKELKIIKQDYNPKTDKLELMERPLT